MARTTAVAVQLILETDASISLTPFIEAANLVVTKNCADANPDYTETELEIIERWLSAHFYCMRDPRSSSESAGGVSASYQGTTSLGFDLSYYGQMAMRLDWFGGLAALNQQVLTGRKARSARMSFLGTKSEELTEALPEE